MAKDKREKSKIEMDDDYFYMDNSIYNYEYADYVKLNSSPRGMFLAFGKYCPEKKKFGIFKEILLPFDIADALSDIMKNHLQQLEDKKLIERKAIEKEAPRK